MGKSVVQFDSVDANLKHEKARTEIRLQPKYDRFARAEHLVGTKEPSQQRTPAAPLPEAVVAPESGSAPEAKAKVDYVPKADPVTTEKFSFHPRDLERLDRLQDKLRDFGLRYRSEVLRLALIVLEQQSDDALSEVACKLDILKPGKVRQRKSKIPNVGH